MPSTSSSSTLTVLSKCTVYPNQKSNISDLKLSISDLAMLSCHDIQKRCLFSLPFHSLLPHLKSSLSLTLSHFPTLAGRLTTDSHGYVYITCNDAGVDFLQATATGYSVHDLLSPPDVPGSFKHFFTFDKKVSYTGHFSSLLAVQVTELADGVFIGCAMNHAIADGTSFWNFFNTFAEICREATYKISNVPDFRRDSILISKAVLELPEGGPKITINPDEPLRERIFSFCKEAMKKLKATVNSKKLTVHDFRRDSILISKAVLELPEGGPKITFNPDEPLRERIFNVPDFRRDSILISKAVLELPEGGPKITFNPVEPLRERIFSFSKEAMKKLKATVNSEKLTINGEVNAVELIGKQKNDSYHNNNQVKVNDETSSFQSLCALLRRGVTSARKLHPSKTTEFKMAVNFRMRLEPKLDPYYFGNAIQGIPTYATSEDVECRGLRWCAEQLKKNVKAHDDAMVRRLVEDWERNPRCFPLGNHDGTSVTMGSSPRFPMYDNDFGWGRPMAVRSGGGNKFDGKI